MAKRIGLSNRLRFEVFKRDSFKCQYCGKSAPDIILHIDHIEPVSKGGENNILNLITSCFECNNGKSNKRLSDNSAVSLQKKQLDELNERREQLTMLIEWKSILEDKSYEIDSIVSYFNQKNKCDISLTAIGTKNLTILIKKYPADKIIDAINDAYDKYYGELDVEGIWDKIPRMLNFLVASDSDKQKMKFFGGVKARFNDTSGYNYWNIGETNKIIRLLFDVIDNGNQDLTYSHLFRVLNNNNTYNSFRNDINDLYDQYYN